MRVPSLIRSSRFGAGSCRRPADVLKATACQDCLEARVPGNTGFPSKSRVVPTSHGHSRPHRQQDCGITKSPCRLTYSIVALEMSVGGTSCSEARVPGNTDSHQKAWSSKRAMEIATPIPKIIVVLQDRTFIQRIHARVWRWMSTGHPFRSSNYLTMTAKTAKTCQSGYHFRLS
jgi:hypothetical protein